MTIKAKSIRTFIGAKNFEDSRAFYLALGFKESVIDLSLSYFMIDENIGFYLQKYYVRKWVDNSMVFLEVEDVEKYLAHVRSLGLHEIYKNVRISEIKEAAWGKEFFMHDPAGVLWHIGEFTSH